MRNIIIIALAILSLTACTREEINNTPQSDAITFGNSVMEYSASTRATILDNNTLNSFRVWGFYKDNDAQTVFDGTLVQKNNDVWGYEGPTRYWIPDRNYYFAATAPISENIAVTPKMDMDSENAINSITFTNKGKEDLIYGKFQQTATYSGNNPSAVTLNFQHLLSKVIFSFKNSVNPYLNMKISDIKVTVPGEASIDLSGNTKVWEVNESAGLFQVETNSTTPELIATDGTGVSEDLFFIPTETEYNVSFKITLMMDGVSEVLYSKTHTATIPSVNLAMGKAYSFSADISHDVITGSEDLQFEIIHLQNWDLETPQSGYEYWNTFGDLSKLLVASKLGGEVTLSNYVEVIDPITVTDTLTLNLNGQTLEYKGSAQSLFSVIKDDKDNYEYGDPSIFTINGNSNDNSKIVSNTTIANVKENSTLLINGGYHESNNANLYKSDGGNIKIVHGKFLSKNSNPQILAMSGTTGKITVSGGEFYKWDPSNGDGESKENSPLNFLEIPDNLNIAKYVVTPKQDWNIVLKKYTVKDPDNNKNDIASAFEDPNASIIDVTTEIVEFNDVFELNNRGEVTLNMGDNTFIGSVGEGYSGVVVNNTNLTVNSGNFEGGGFQVAYAGSKLTLNNSNITITSRTTNGRYCVYAVNSAKVIVNGGTLDIGLQTQNAWIFVGWGAVVELNGCTCAAFSGTGTPSKPPIICVEGGELIINGGTYNFDPNKMAVTYSSYTNPGSIIIKGGTFPLKPTKYIAEGYKAFPNDEDTPTEWTVALENGPNPYNQPSE